MGPLLSLLFGVQLPLALPVIIGTRILDEANVLVALTAFLPSDRATNDFAPFRTAPSVSEVWTA